MNELDALQDLLAKIEAGGARPHEVFNAFDTPCQDMALQQRAEDAKNAYNGSLDAAKALHDAVLSGWDIQIVTYDDDAFESSVAHPLKVKTHDGVSAYMARAWLIAIIKALIAE